MRARHVGRPALQVQPRAWRRWRRCVLTLVGLAGDHLQPRVAQALLPAVGDRQPCEQSHFVTIGRQPPNIVRGPVEPLRHVGQLDGRGGRPRRARQDRQRRPRGQRLGHPVIEDALRQPRTAQRLQSFRGLKHHPAVRPGLNDRCLFANLAGDRVHTAQQHPPLQIGIDKPGRRDQPCVTVLLAHPTRQPRDDRSLGQQPFGDVLETNLAIALRHRDGAGLGDEGIAARPVSAHSARAVWVAVHRHRDVGHHA
ncbi:hypothetical protein SPMU_33110 [Sphingomonas mucosissima]|uniref:Uncharacterized protein n=1 Tax=Sphingomonas mucosissima TaxID=370959 RepID=A0A245ZDS5_9SPHN|nr:hypothetical protein SPMU_33110 [Sphingomonas mucosissima]